MFREMSTKLGCTEIKIKKLMLWNRWVEERASLVVTGETLFAWIFNRDTAVSSKTMEMFFVGEACKEKEISPIVRTNIELDGQQMEERDKKDMIVRDIAEGYFVNREDRSIQIDMCKNSGD